ncbi:RNA-directed DNA polymerase (Reverse transcriptase) domain containing protein [Elysia marginata]|uniref:RNA-directed DNA polymerase (Reverse transcriptase) domain containing protein n=1 Tax=Elysia marginata TaxID=1093978 RepID=A0AAV4EBD4_9GAST|nr:RNA-directed DNA polymerase (Reverse transcriptase) domain containing protein [Elysia marginata]
MDRITQAANPDPECLNELLFADDQALFSPDKDTLQEHINQLNRQCEAHGMRINIKKTEAITISRNETTTAFNIEGNALLNATEFKYLGSFFTKDGRIDREIEVRCQKANSISYQLAPLLKHESIPIATKAKLINSILTTLTYQCQTLPLTQGPKNKLVTCEMRCLRKVVNRTRRDKIRNEVIRAQVGATPVLQHVENQQIKWFGHLMRRPTDQPAHQTYNSRYSGKRPRGRPRRRCSDSVADTLKGNNKSLCEASHLAVERRLHLPETPDGTSGRKKVK